MKKVIAVLAACMMLFSSAKADTYYCYAEEVNIRPTASTKHERLGYVEFGQEIEVEYFKGDWAYCPELYTEEIGGWVYAQWLSPYEPQLVENEKYVVTDRRVNVREQPNGRQIKRVGKGHEMTVIRLAADMDGVWWAKTTEGWIMLKFLDKE